MRGKQCDRVMCRKKILKLMIDGDLICKLGLNTLDEIIDFCIDENTDGESVCMCSDPKIMWDQKINEYLETASELPGTITWIK